MQNLKSLIWVTNDPSANRRSVESAAADCDCEVRFCAPSELSSAIRAARYDLVGIELGNDGRETATVRELHERFPALVIFAACASTDVAVMRAALQAGASDFLSLPLDPRELRKALIRFSQAAPPPAAPGAMIGGVITVYGVRGGLGATTLAVNLAARIAALTGESSALVDLDLQRGDVSSFLNLSPAQSLASLAAASGEVDALFLHQTLSRHPSGVYVLPAPAEVEEVDQIGREHVEMALSLLRSRFRWTIIDTARSLSEVSLVAFEQSERILLLTDLSVPGVRATRRTLGLLSRLGLPLDAADVVVVESARGNVKLDEAVRALGKEPMFTIPRDDAAAVQAMNAGAPLNGSRPARLTTAVEELARKVTGQTAAPRRGRLWRLFGRKGATA
jgi:pilus assembly protein CpaE